MTHPVPSSRGARRLVLATLAALLPAALSACGTRASAQDATGQEAPAKAAERVVATVGEPAPDFTLKDLDGVEHTLSDYTKDGKLVVLEWFNPDCPIAKGYHTPKNLMAALATEFRDKGVVWLAINSGAEGRQGAGVERNKRAVEDYGIPYPVLLDMDGKVGHLYAAKTTPHMYVIDAEGVLRYAGAIDDGDPRRKGDLNYVRQALTEVLAGKPVTTKTSKPFGCSVKYGS